MGVFNSNTFERFVFLWRRLLVLFLFMSSYNQDVGSNSAGRNVPRKMVEGGHFAEYVSGNMLFFGLNHKTRIHS